MQKDAEEHAEEDKKRKEEVDLRNEVDQLIFTTEKTLKETKGKVSDEDTKKVQDALDDLKKAQKDNNLDEMKEKKDALSKAAQDLAVKLTNKMVVLKVLLVKLALKVHKVATQMITMVALKMVLSIK